VNKDELQKRGMASYTLVSRDARISRIFPHATVVQVSYSPQTSGNSRELARRQGAKAFVAVAESSQGNLKSNIILPDQEAAIIAGIDQSTNALKECRVVIVVSP
jgi:hypothetical protein